MGLLWFVVGFYVYDFLLMVVEVGKVVVVYEVVVLWFVGDGGVGLIGFFDYGVDCGVVFG